MPLYTVSTSNTLDQTVKTQIAAEITKIHCDVTGAPETFVNVVFWDDFPLAKSSQLHILSAVRKGRKAEMRADLQSQLASKISQITGLKAQSIETDLFEIPARFVMEGGHILPDPGEEAQCEWLNETQA